MEQPSGFKDLLSNMMARRWYITALVLGGFMFIVGGMFFAILHKNTISLVLMVKSLTIGLVIPIKIKC